MRQCEKFSLNNRTRAWKALPSMREARHCFNPCLFSGCVYVCGSGSLLIEGFVPHTDSFLPLKLSLPETYLGCTLLLHNNLLVVHSKNYIVKFAVQQAQLVQHSPVPSQEDANKWPNSQPVLDSAHRFFFIFQYDQCICFDVETGVQVQRFS